MNQREEMTPEELERYRRTIALPELGVTGQMKLLQSRVLIAGLGGLGSPCAYYLAAAGIGTIGVCDGDSVELSNLQRQIIHATKDLGRLKVLSATDKLHDLNPGISIETHGYRLTPENVMNTICQYDVIVDCTDSFATKYLLNDACVLKEKRYVHAGAQGVRGQVLGVVPYESACLRCLMPALPKESGLRQGILPPVAGVVGALQAIEVIHVLTEPVYSGNRLIVCEPFTGSVRSTIVSRNPRCPLCGHEPMIRSIREEYYR